DPGNYDPVAEICDGLDNDCANGIDDGLGPIPAVNIEGECVGNIQVCTGGAYQDDPGNYDPVAEICDGLDNDCANGVDDGMGPIPADNVDGECASNEKICMGVLGYQDDPANYVPVAESCDGLDNDCANGVDDGLGPIPADNVEGECVGNIQVCTGVGGYQDDPGNYVPVPEVCDGLDNDCANGIDDGLGPIPADNILGECVDNVKICMGGDGYQDSPENYDPVDEICDGLDNDCDGNVADEEDDEDEDGWRICQGDCDDEEDRAHPGLFEILDVGNCNDGIDNDCDSLIDSDPECRMFEDEGGVCGCATFEETGDASVPQLAVSGLLYLLPIGFVFVLLRRNKSVLLRD
ncbi:MopE-related protein, partial [Thermodesulfobacteriota bacterium]